MNAWSAGGHQPGLEIDEVAVVRVPVDADVGDAVVGPEDGDQRHARLDQPAGLEDRLAVRVSGRSGRGARGLRGQVERLRARRGGQQVEGAVVVRCRARATCGCAVQVAGLGVDRLRAAPAVVEPARATSVRAGGSRRRGSRAGSGRRRW